MTQYQATVDKEGNPLFYIVKDHGSLSLNDVDSFWLSYQGAKERLDLLHRYLKASQPGYEITCEAFADGGGES